MKKSFIEESFPVREVSEESAREKNIRHGHISTLHIWWARRPLASSRATIYASLIPPAKTPEEWNKERNFIIELSKWENSLNPDIIGKAIEKIRKSNGERPLRMLDPFAGGGSIPLEAMRLGLEAHAIDYNPVATLILKCTLEYPQKFGKPVKVKVKEGMYEVEKDVNPLLEEVKKWGQWVLEEAKKEIGKFYPADPDGSVPVGYVWARTIPCQNPSCGAEIPIMRQFWLAKKDKKKVSLFPYVEGKEVKFKIVGTGYEPMPKGFEPEQGTVSRAHAKCLVCGAVIDDKTTRRLFQEGKSGQRMIAVVLASGNSGKKYRIATEKDVDVFREAEKYLEEKRQKLMEEWGIDPVPDEPIRSPGNKEYDGTLFFNFTPILLYRMSRWGDLFNSRQKLALITFTEKVKLAYKKMIEEGFEEEFAKAVVSYLGLGIDRMTTFGCVITRWEPMRETPANVFGRQALPIMWDYVDINPFSGASGGWDLALSWILGFIEHCSQTSKFPAPVTQASATSLPYPDNYFDAVFTDPPYYDNVPYSYLSDFFYVWLKRTLGDIYPELFATPLTPNNHEIIAELPLLRGMHKEKAKLSGISIKSKDHFEDMLKKAFQEIYRVLKPEGIAVIVYAHKSTAGWETLINSLLDCGLVITASWPIDTEMKSRLRANESAALASSIYLVARKIQRKQIGYLNEVKNEIKQHLKQKLQNLWKEGVSGSDFFIAGIGSAIEVFGKYEKVMDYEGNIIRADRLLEFVREIVTDYAVREILHNGVAGEISPLTRFYILYRWLFGEARAEFDEARKLASSSGFEIADYFNRSFIKKEKEFIKILGPHERDLEEFELGANSELIDVLHKCLVLWSLSKNDEIVKLLHESGYGYKEMFYKVAQAVSECLPIESKEKKMLDGFLTGKERYIDGIKKQSEPKQGRLIW
ncbi:MAG: DUF1156 domain-containing protein [Candidatus Bathyarchaeia archaeon]